MERKSILVARSKDINAKSYADFYTKYANHPEYSESILYTTTKLRQIVTKLEVLLFTNKGDLITEPNMGCDLESYLHDFFVNIEVIRTEINTQISTYIPEMNGIYEMDIVLYEANTENNPSNQNIIYIFFLIDEGYQILITI